MRKLVYESLAAMYEGKRSEYAHREEKKLSTGKVEKPNLDKIAKAKEAIAALKVQLADAKKVGKMKDSNTGGKAKIAQIQDKINKWNEKIVDLKEFYINYQSENINEGLFGSAGKEAAQRAQKYLQTPSPKLFNDIFKVWLSNSSDVTNQVVSKLTDDIKKSLADQVVKLGENGLGKYPIIVKAKDGKSFVVKGYGANTKTAAPGAY